MLYKLSEFIETPIKDENAISYWYQGTCPLTGLKHQLPRTQLSEAVASGLMKQLAADEQYTYEEKMYGVLIVETAPGKLQVLKAFSGLLRGKAELDGWVGPISGRNSLQMQEAYTLTLLEDIKQELLSLQNIPERKIYQQLSHEFQVKLDELATKHQHSRQKRQKQRDLYQSALTGETLTQELEILNEQSRLEGIERKRLKSQRDEALKPIEGKILEADTRIRHLKQRRKALSHQLQQLMSANYSLSNFAGESLSLEHLGTLPTGAGECCAPKLLHYAATHNLTPVAMAEFWWGPDEEKQGKVRGAFYPACATRCQPLMGFLLAGLSQKQEKNPYKPPLSIIYEDEDLIIINKPSGLLSVPGRGSANYDSVITRLKPTDESSLMSVHRLDQDTSGILVLARHQFAYNFIAQQFRERKVKKVYHALVQGGVTQAAGTIKLPLWGDPLNRPYQKVDFIQGKESITHFRVIDIEFNCTRLELMPITGRTHQIRVHCADVEGLGTPIIGDRLYGPPDQSGRLCLHAAEISFIHPKSHKKLTFRVESPF